MAKRTEFMQHSTEYLRDEIQRLLDRSRSILETGMTGTHRVVNDLGERLQAGADKLSDYYSVAKQRTVEGARQTDQTIRAHPYESLAIALGVGVMLGALLRGGGEKEKRGNWTD